MFLMAYINSSKLGRRKCFLVKLMSLLTMILTRRSGLIYLMTRVAIVDATNKMPKIIVELNKIFSKPLLVW